MNLEYFKKWVKDELKIDLTAYKETQLHRRLLSLMSRIGVKTVDEYIKLLKTDKDQRQKFLDFVTINVTEFFRNPDIFDEFNNILIKEARSKQKLKIWSAACSIGAEPYSIAMILNSNNAGKGHKIIATDIDATILDKARAGVFNENEIKNIDSNLLSKYFSKEDSKYVISPSIKSMITFKKHDLILGSYEKDFDVIVCRNVVIYFKQEIKDKIYQKFSQSLKSGGLLFVGATESIYNYRDFGFEKASTFIYKKL
ncbi:CheR family methyltransferase [Oceanirhabdus seepicola]|uniref:protein-glutamate O-methyltransferase n=1 Tax=Oceanirhabdus seepicola TaxID=2828781 RepID=A0A9J6NUJ0_9CLOT|nr:protein-glutamate O-methyltransferase CheR [Oceanirhabdus seepicola]MCM1988122.1 protein-glutamate O-methyltransferase CheR [Oceanirhabdus seepicola]